MVTVALSAFGRLAGPALGPAVALVWSQLAASLPEYERRFVFASESDSEGEDADGPAALRSWRGTASRTWRRGWRRPGRWC